MLKLSSLTLSGFKSFPQTTKFTFGPGITAVVGPNGCGKSNVVDAMAWVLGEQSAKNLRGARMSDVIFAGTARRPALGMAEVTLQLERLGPDGEHLETVEVARRVFRDGEAEYTLNGRRARLQDVRDVLFSEGVSEEAYSIIEQGRVDEILSAKPEERRAVIEQAARIGQFKLKRHQTELKLHAAKENLARVEDIRQEMEKRMTTLKIQAGRARRHQELSADVMRFKRILFGRKAIVLERDYREADALWNTLHAQDAQTLARITSAEADHEARRTAFTVEQEAVNALRDAVEQTGLAIERATLQIRHDRARVEELGKRREESEALAATLAARAGEARAAWTETDAKRRAFASEFARAEEVERTAATRDEEVRRRAAQFEETLDALTGRAAALMEDAASAHAERGRAEEECRLRDAAAERLAHDTAAARRELDEARLIARSLAEEFESARSHSEESLRRAGHRRAALDALRRERDGFRERMRAAREALQETAIRLAYLEEEESRGAEALAAVARRAAGKIADFVQVSAEWERAADAMWGERLAGFAFHDVFDLRAVAAEARAAAASAWLASPDSARATPAAPQAGLGTLRAAARSDTRWRPLVEALPDAVLVESVEDAQAIRREFPDAVCVARDGSVVDSGGFVRVGRAAGIFSRRREIAELRLRHERLREESALFERVARDAETRVVETEKALAHARDEAQALDRGLHALEARLAAARESLTAREARCAALEGEERRLAEERRAAEARRTGAENRLRAIEFEAARLREERDTAEASAARAGAEAAKAAEEHARAREALAGMRERLRTLEVAAQAAKESLDGLDAQRRKAEEDAKALLAERERTEAGLRDWESRLAVLLREKDAQAEQYRARMEARAKEEAALLALDKSLRAMHHEYEAFKNTLAQAGMRRAELAASLQAVVERMREDFPGETAETLAASLSEEERAADLDAVERDLLDAEDKLRKLGAVNLLAVEEFREVEERFTFLSSQRDDIMQSIASLDATLRDLDAASSERFKNAFLAIQENFRRVFARLFEGGVADLRLEPEEDWLNGGVEITAQPPGKKLQSIALLSGGEKALSAIAFLFAAFEFRPSPFCILDEVDAALDDANVERFGRMLRHYAESVQFLCITHNKRTMAAANALYGVTMEEPGVSKVVSVRLESPPA